MISAAAVISSTFDCLTRLVYSLDGVGLSHGVSEAVLRILGLVIGNAYLLDVYT